MQDFKNKTIMITGCSSGFGYLVAKKFLENDFNVIVTMKDLKKGAEFKNYKNALLLKLDVTDISEVEHVTKEAIEKFGTIDVLVNNAGFGALGMFECASKTEIENQFNVNLFGAINVMQAVIPFMRRAKTGRIINISSIAGRFGFGGLSIYNASKFALEGLSEALRLELDEFNIKVQLIEPGAFKTNFNAGININNGRLIDDDMKDRFKKYHEKLIERLSCMTEPFEYGDPKDVANLIYKCGIGRINKFRNLIGKDAKMILFMKKILPDVLFFKLMKIFHIYK